MVDEANPLDLREMLADASYNLQVVSQHLGRTSDPDLRLRFPRGFLRTAEQHRKTYPFLKNELLKRNLAYSFMLADVYWWLLHRTDLASVPADMVVKAAIVLQGAIAEATLVDVQLHHDRFKMGKRKSFKSRTQCLCDNKVISGALMQELNWLWDIRNQQHLYELTFSEFDSYQRTDLERASAAVANLFAELAHSLSQ